MNDLAEQIEEEVYDAPSAGVYMGINIVRSSIIDFARAGQMSVITPFCLAGAMAPISVAGALTLSASPTVPPWKVLLRTPMPEGRVKEAGSVQAESPPAELRARTRK